ncbi:BclA C-terminal domain-containing protein [Cohnella hashimotonis]|uniref:BclA C-terminal domain-containing protein n=1 Tax=Cohnella hashimotonis TaxID=2826895 RepID=UPI0033140ACB
MNATVIGGADVPFSSNGPSFGGVVHNAGMTTFTVPNTGIYKINYDLSITAGIGSAMAIAVNGVVDPSTNVNSFIATGNLNGVAYLNLAAGDVITLRNNSAVPQVLSLAPGVGAQLVIEQVA